MNAEREGEEFDRAKALASTASARAAIRGIAQLQGIALSQTELATRCADAIGEVLLATGNSSVVEACIVALRNIGLERYAPLVLRFATATTWRVRRTVADALLTMCSPEYEAEIRTTLLALSNDRSAAVRNWATFTLGQLEFDDPEVREALIARLGENDGEIRGEALVGLAQRGDRRVIEYLKLELRRKEIGALAIEAAKAIGDPALLPMLNDLSGWWDVDPELVHDAIAACRVGSDPD